MHIIPNNKLSNHYRKRKVEKTVWIEDQTVSSSFQQNIETMKEKTKNQIFYEDYLNPVFSFSNNYFPNFFSACPSMLSNDFNGSMMNPYANNNDGMLDGYEVMYGLNPLLNDADLDHDKDGLSNLEEFELGTKANNWDSDGDGMPDYYEVYYGLNASNLNDANDDLDSDGLLNIDEFRYNISAWLNDNFGIGDVLLYDATAHGIYWNGTNPSNPDTDYDGLKDGEEYDGFDFNMYYYDLDGSLVTGLCSVPANVLSPLNPDYDGDGLSDGQEKDGWTVMVAYKSGDDMETKEYIFKTNPAENNSILNLDSDQDGILDKDEIGMSKLCDYYQSVSDWKNIYSELYDKYSWFIENRVEKATSWSAWNETIQSQFNPYVKENIPPIITAFKSDFEYDTKWYGISFTINYLFGSYTASVGLNIIEAIWVKTTVSVFDAGSISSLSIGLSTGVSIPTLSWSGITYEDLVMNIGSQTYTNIESGWNSFEFIKSADGLTWAIGQAIGFDAKVSVTDMGGEITTITLHRDGLFDKAWDFLTEIWSQMVGVVSAAVKAAVDAINSIINWIIEKVTAMINAVLEPIVSAINSWIQEISNYFNKASSEYEKSNNIDESTSDSVRNLFTGGGLFDALVILGTVLYAALLIATPFTISFTFLLGTLIELLIPLILNAVAGMLSGDYPSLISAALTGDAGGFISALSTVVDISGKVVAVASLILSIITVKLVPMITTVVGLILSVMGAIIVWFGITTLDMVVGAGVASFGLYLVYKGPPINPTFNKISKVFGWACVITSILTLIQKTAG